MNPKRDLFVRENTTTPPISAMNSSLLTKDIYLSRDRERDRIENMTNSVKTDESKRKQQLAKDSDSFVGFSDLPNQIHRKTVKKGFEFTLMVVGMSSLILFYLVVSYE